MFGLGAREAVLAAVTGDPTARRGFGAPAGAEMVASTLAGVSADPGGTVTHLDDETGGLVVVTLSAGDPRDLGRLEARLAVAAFGLGWEPVPPPADDLGRIGFRRSS